MSCIFCKIVSKEIPTQIIYEDVNVVAFNDITPVAPLHILVIPKKHIESVDCISADDADISAAMFIAAKEIAKMKNLTEGYRIIINNGKAAGQEVFHLHMHILGRKENLGPMLQR